MREYLFQGKRTDNGEWVEGCLIHQGNHYLILQDESVLHPMDVPYINDLGCIDGYATPVIPESIGQYTGMKEFVVSDKSFNKPLFEGDIVEVWSTRRPCYGYPKSQHDGDVKVRAVVCFKDGEWRLDYNNNYNKSLEKLRGREEEDRTVDGDWRLYYFGCYDNEEWHREHNAHYKWSDIVKLGNVFDNKDLLEG